MNAQLTSLIDSIPEFQGKEVSVEPLSGGLTNKNYLLKAGQDRFVLRIAGENSESLGIDRAVEYASAQAAFRAGIAPEVIAFFPRQQAMVTRFVNGKVLTSEDSREPAIMNQLVASLRAFHTGPGGRGHFSVFETIRRYIGLAQKSGVALPPEIGPALGILSKIETATGAARKLVPCHNDLLPANFVQEREQNKIWILDWEYAGMGDLFFDLANVAANNQFNAADEELLLHNYFGSVFPADLARLRLLRMASDLREATWGFLQLGISKLDFDYRAYAMQHLQRFANDAGRIHEGMN